MSSEMKNNATAKSGAQATSSSKANMVHTDDLISYYNVEKLPTIWCSGCGLGTVTRSLVTALHKLIADGRIDREKTILVSGIGCSGRMTGYLDFSSVHVTHGRALSFATGIKMASPELNVIVIMGDGDASAIGGNHLIHAARRNMGLTALVCNNSIYGMTGGQYSPTTPTGDQSTTSLYGNIEPGFDLCRLAAAAGASFVGRGTAFNSTQLTSVIEEAILHDGFSFIEAITQCPTYYGRKNDLKTPFSMLESQKQQAVNIKRAEKMAAEALEDKYVTGILHREERAEYTKSYAEIVKKARAAMPPGTEPPDRAARNERDGDANVSESAARAESKRP